MTSTKALTIALILLARAAAAAPLTELDTGVAHMAPMTMLGKAEGVAAAMTNGTFQYWGYTSAGWYGYAIPGHQARSNLGIAAQADYIDGGYYVFETEATGLYEARSLDDGRTWSWCQLDSRTDLVSAPSAVYLGPGAGFRVFARDGAQVQGAFYNAALVAWTVDPAGGFCQSHTSRTIGYAVAGPIATSWGGTRVDLFAVDGTGVLEHMWSNDGNSYGTQTSFEVSFEGQAASAQSYPMSWTNGGVPIFAASAPYNGALDVVIGGSSYLEHLSYRSGWREDDLLVASEVVAASPAYASKCNAQLGCSMQWTTDADLYTGTGTQGRAMFTDGTFGPAEDYAAPANIVELTSATMAATGEHVLFATDGETAYWTAGNDGI